MDLVDEAERIELRHDRFLDNFYLFMELIADDESDNFYGLDCNNRSQTECDCNEPPMDEFEAFKFYLEEIKANGTFQSIAQECGPKNLGPTCEVFVGFETFSKETLSYKAPDLKGGTNKLLCCASNSVMLNETGEDEGDFLKASKPVKCGEILIRESATVIANTPNCVCSSKSLLRCYNCVKPLLQDYIRCPKCKIVMTCPNRKCQKQLNRYHEYECFGMTRHLWGHMVESPAYLGMRMMMHGASMDFDMGDPDPESLQLDHYCCCFYGVLYNLRTNMTRLDESERTDVLKEVMKTMCYLVECTTYLQQLERTVPVTLNKYQLFVFIGGLVYRHTVQVLFNSVYLILPDPVTGKAIGDVDRSIRAICPVVAYMRHSCDPNAALSFYDDVVVVTAIRNIKTEEPITIAYREISLEKALPIRQNICMSQFKFMCQCAMCLSQLAYGDRVLKCAHCPDGKLRVFAKNDDKVLRYFLYQVGYNNTEIAKKVIDFLEKYLQDRNNTKNIQESTDNLPHTYGTIKILKRKQKKKDKIQNPSSSNDTIIEDKPVIANKLRQKLSEAFGAFTLKDDYSETIDLLFSRQYKQTILSHNDEVINNDKMNGLVKMDYFTCTFGRLLVVDTLLPVDSELPDIIHIMNDPTKMQTVEENWKKIFERTSGHGSELIVYIIEKPDIQKSPVQGLCGSCFTLQDVEEKVKMLEVIEALCQACVTVKKFSILEAYYGLCDLFLHPDCTEMNVATLGLYKVRKGSFFLSMTLDLILKLTDANIRRFGKYNYRLLCNLLKAQAEVIYFIAMEDLTKIDRSNYDKLKQLCDKHRQALCNFRMYAPHEKSKKLIYELEHYERVQLKKMKKNIDKKK